MTRISTLMTSLTVAALVLASSLAGWAQDSNRMAPGSAATQPSTQPAGAPSAQDIMNQLLKQRQETPVIEPTVRPDNAPGGLGVATNQVDPRVLGVAPGQEAPKLRREGEFVVGRRGRVVRAPNSNHLLFSFSADAKESAEPPMVLMPCQLLQSMEQTIQERGDKLVFIVSGQVFTYRGANYLLFTMWNLDVDRGNLQP